MKLRIIVGVLMLCHLLPIITEAQQDRDQIRKLYNDYKYNNTFEYAYLKPAKKIFYSGESLNFEVAVFNQYFSLTDLSKIVYAELIHENDKYFEKVILKMDKGVANGVINLPINIPTGNYQLVAYTQFMKNHDIENKLHRVPIYIQNTSEEAVAMVSEILGAESEVNANIANTSRIKLRNDDNYMYVRVDTEGLSGTHYLISEGFKSIQLSAQFSTKRDADLKLPLTRFVGSFQKLMLLDQELNVIDAKPFFIQKESFINSSFVDKNEVQIEVNNNFLSQISLTKTQDIIDADSIDLFRRIYRLYYNIPYNTSIVNLSFNELIADTTMQKFASQSVLHWGKIIISEKLDEQIVYLPEQNIRIQGKVTSQEPIEEAAIAFHLFENDLDLSAYIDPMGKFEADLVLPSGVDLFKASVFNKDSENITDEVVVEYAQTERMNYDPNVKYYSRSTSDSVIESEIEFKYVLSTFSEGDLDSYFWEDMQFDQTFRVSDYFTLEDFEEFIREAVMNVTVSQKNGKKGLNILNGTDGTFDKPYLLILDNEVLSDPTPIFDIPLDSIEFVKTAFNEETLRDIGTTIAGGVLVVKTLKGDSSVDSDFKDKNFQQIVGYNYSISKNEVSDMFNQSEISRLTSKEQNSLKEVPSQQILQVESISKSGAYEFVSVKPKN